ncbi:MAG: PAS domain-containing protein [Planctomycetes bacterium]|nr:PAS domain-containing protein [Planctomycetota bacterium]
MPSAEQGARGDVREEAGAHGAPPGRGLRTRLTVTLPLAAGFVVLLSAFVLLWLCYPLFFESSRVTSVQAMERRVTWVFTLGGALALVGLVVAVVVTEWLARPLRSLMSQMESARRITGEHPAARQAAASTDLAQSAVKEVAESLATLVHNGYTLRSLEGGVVTLDQSGVVTSFSPVAERVLGCPAGEAIGRSLGQALPEDPANAAFVGSVREALSGAGRASSVEAEVRTRDGRRAHIGYTITPLRDEAGKQLGCVLTFKNLADRKVAQQVVRQAENLALLGSMAFRLAHEIGNPLTAMSGLVELIRDGSPPDSPHREYCRTVLESIERLKRITDELLTIGHPEPRRVEPVDINGLVRHALALYRHDPATKGIPIKEAYQPDLPRVPGDPERLVEVVLNILRNACRAVQGGGEIAVATSSAGPLVAVAITNTGPPIPPEAQKMLFTPFYTTERRGTGLGLAMSQALVKAHGGRIAVESSAESGTTFTIELPTSGATGEAVA